MPVLADPHDLTWKDAMATRPVFISPSTGTALVQVMPITFTWFAGMALSRKQMSIRSLHEAIIMQAPTARPLEASRASEEVTGQELSAFNLTFPMPGGDRETAVECAFQGAKVFEHGGPYTDLFEARPLDAKRDPRLQDSGRLIGFKFSGQDWDLEPRTAYYDWIYINALHRRGDLADAVMAYDTFTDIAFNPERSINCQAGSVALYVSLRRRNLLQQALKSRDDYLRVVSANERLF